MLSALIQTARDPEPPAITDDAEGPSKKRQLRLDSNYRVTERGTTKLKSPLATLIVAPTSLLNQWSEELNRSSKPDTLNVLVWHGQNRLDLESVVEQKGVIPVIISYYGTLVSEYTRWSSKITSPIFEGTRRGRA